MRLPTYGKPRIIACAEEHPHHIGLPRGCLDDVRQLLADLGIKPIVRDERNAGAPHRAHVRTASCGRSSRRRPRRCWRTTQEYWPPRRPSERP